MSKPIFIQSEVFRRPAFGAHHPLSIARIETVYDLCAALGWTDGRVSACAAAPGSTLARFHAADYLAALAEADRTGQASIASRRCYNLGVLENPIFPRFLERASTAVGGSILAAKLALEGRTAFHPAGGTHHAGPARASGFCYLNDPVFAILTLLDAGLTRVLYVDLDAHHGDGVENAFAADPRVFTVSIHEERRWPGTGCSDDRREGRARNLAAPWGLNDSEYGFLIEEAVMPLAQRLAPEAVVVVAGADVLGGDPLSKMALSNSAAWEATVKVAATAPAAVVLGGGGYNPWTLARFWTGLWGRLAGEIVPRTLPLEARAPLSGLTCDLIDDEDVDPSWLTELTDSPNAGEIRPRIRELAAQALAP